MSSTSFSPVPNRYCYFVRCRWFHDFSSTPPNFHCSQSLASRETHIHELQQQVLLLSQGEAARSSEQQARLGALISSFNQLRETCEQQV